MTSLNLTQCFSGFVEAGGELGKSSEERGVRNDERRELVQRSEERGDRSKERGKSGKRMRKRSVDRTVRKDTRETLAQKSAEVAGILCFENYIYILALTWQVSLVGLIEVKFGNIHHSLSRLIQHIHVYRIRIVGTVCKFNSHECFYWVNTCVRSVINFCGNYKGLKM